MFRRVSFRTYVDKCVYVKCDNQVTRYFTDKSGKIVWGSCEEHFTNKHFGVNYRELSLDEIEVMKVMRS
jgi:hypothetical protein